MAIFHPGQKFRYHRLLSRKKSAREVVAILSLTAMVDMFTVLVVFLLQNYNVTGEVIYIPEEVKLPKASFIKELKPSNVVTVSKTEILLEKEHIASFAEVKHREDWMIPKLKAGLEAAFREREKELKSSIRGAVAKGAQSFAEELVAKRKVTVQADKDIDFLTLKKVMFTVTEAGASEINFAVLQGKKTEN